MKNILSLIFVSALLVGCGTVTPGNDAKPEAASGAQSGSGTVAVKRYSMHGKVVALNPDKTIRIDAGAIGDWMDTPMTMNYPVYPATEDADRAKLTVGTTFDATVLVKGDDFWVTDVKPVK